MGSGVADAAARAARLSARASAAAAAASAAAASAAAIAACLRSTAAAPCRAPASAPAFSEAAMAARSPAALPRSSPRSKAACRAVSNASWNEDRSISVARSVLPAPIPNQVAEECKLDRRHADHDKRRRSVVPPGPWRAIRAGCAQGAPVRATPASLGSGNSWRVRHLNALRRSEVGALELARVCRSVSSGVRRGMAAVTRRLIALLVSLLRTLLGARFAPLGDRGSTKRLEIHVRPAEEVSAVACRRPARAQSRARWRRLVPTRTPPQPLAMTAGGIAASKTVQTSEYWERYPPPTERGGEPSRPARSRGMRGGRCAQMPCRRQDSNLRHADYDSAALTS